MAPDEEVQPGRVAAPHLEAVDRRQRLLHREVAGERGRAGVAPGEVGDRPGGAQPVAAHGPQRVAQRDQRRRWPLRARRRRRPPRSASSAASTLVGVGVELVEAGVMAADELGSVGEGEHARARRAAAASTRAQLDGSTAAVVDRRRASPARRRGRRARSSARRRSARGREGRLTMPTMPHMGAPGYRPARRADPGGDPAVGRLRGRPATAAGQAARRRRRPAAWRRRLDHDPHQRLGAARPHQHPARRRRARPRRRRSRRRARSATSGVGARRRGR